MIAEFRGGSAGRVARSPREHVRASAECVLVILVVLTGAWLRTLHLDELPFWVDEAESSINALTILQNGYPSDSYVGIPIYENTHVWPWPENPEYEFRDVSYSENHLAVYHGWLPLYAIAASFALHGVQPDHDDGTRVTKHNLEEQKRRTRAARLPSIFFAGCFLLAVFLGGRTICGFEAGWAGLITAAYYPFHISISDQARYYSAQVALSTVCCIMVWLLVRDCRWRHVWLGGCAFVLLFHTHLLSFVNAAAMAGLCLPLIVSRHKDWLKKVIVLGAIVAAGTVPWVIATGFLRHQIHIPSAWPLLRMPSTLWQYPPFNLWYAIPGLAIVIFGLYAYLTRRTLAAHMHSAAVQLVAVLMFLGAWTLVGYAAFLYFIPAVSFSRNRVALSYWGPLFLLGASMCALLVKMMAPRLSRIAGAGLAAFLMLLLFVATGHSMDLTHKPGAGTWSVYAGLFEELNSMRLDSTVKLYAAPNSHLPMMFYSGLPIQDITPVRKRFLDSYRGEIVYIDLGVAVETGLLDVERVQEAALRSGVKLSQEAAEETALRLQTRGYRESMMQYVAPEEPVQLEPLSGFEQKLLTAHREAVAHYFSKFDYELVTRGFVVRDWSDWCTILKYRFVDPEARRGIHANYAQRLRGSDAVILARSGAIAVYRSAWHPPDSPGGLRFRFLR